MSDNRENIINDDLLQNVSGGFEETDGIAAGFNIECPNCHNKNKARFEKWIDLSKPGEWYRCLDCLTVFSVNGQGSVNNNGEINLS